MEREDKLWQKRFLSLGQQSDEMTRKLERFEDFYLNLIDRVGLKVKEGHKRFDPIGGADTDLSQFDDYVAEIFGCFIPLMHKSLNNISKQMARSQYYMGELYKFL